MLPSLKKLSNLNADRMSEILEVLYEAPLDPTRWTEFLRLTALVAGGEAAALLMHDFNKTESSMSAEWGFHPDVARLYTAHYGAIDVWRSAVTASADWLGVSQQFVSTRSLGRTEFYNDLLRPYDIPHGMFAMVERASGRVANLSICRSAQKGPFDEKDLQILRFLKPHIKRAYRLHSEIAAARAPQNGLFATLNAIPGGMILLDSQARVITMNLPAEQIVAAANGLRVRRRRLQAEEVRESSRLGRLIGEAVATSTASGLEPGGAMVISRRDSPPLNILISPVRYSALQAPEQIAALVFIHDPLRQQVPTEDMLRTAYRLSPAESRVALLLSDGRAPREIADTVGVMENTVRSQIKSIFSKTGVRRQGELIRLLLTNVGPTQSS